MELIPLHDYILKSKEERQSHIDLDDPCIELGADSQESRALMAMHLNVFLTKEVKVHLCHACGNGKCSNPKHLYWGTPAENVRDLYDHQPDLGYRIRDTILSKNPDHYSEIGSKGGKKGGGHNKFTPEDIELKLDQISHIDLNKWGSLQKVANVWGVSHTQARRLLNTIRP